MQVLQGGQKMVRKEVELLEAVGVCVCAEYGSLVHKHVEEAANSHFLHEISWDMAHSFSSIKALQHITISTEPQCWKNLWIWRICIWRIGSRRSISRSRSWVGNDGSSRGRGHPEGSQVRAGEALLSKPPGCSHEVRYRIHSLANFCNFFHHHFRKCKWTSSFCENQSDSTVTKISEGITEICRT